MIVSRSQALPPRCTGMMAPVRSVIAPSILPASIMDVSGSESTKTGRAYCRNTTLSVAMKV